jgi:glycosyltransferase involved in cell wall biosynthesis
MPEVGGISGEDPLVSTVIPVFNGERFIRETIESVLSQTYPRVECVVVDESSSDGTARVVASFASKVQYVKKLRGGVSSARNLGVGEARGDYVAFLDADDVWLPQKLEMQMALFRADDGLGLVYSGLHVIDEEGWFIGRIDPPSPQTGLRNTLVLEGPGISVAQTALLPISTFKDVGGFDEALSTSADADFACRVATRHRIAVVPEPLTLYRHHSGQMHLDPQATEHDVEALFGKLFHSGLLPPELERLERRARANLHVSLAGKFIRSRDLRNFWRHVFLAARHDPRRLVAAANRLSTSGGPRDFRWM